MEELETYQQISNTSCIAAKYLKVEGDKEYYIEGRAQSWLSSG